MALQGFTVTIQPKEDSPFNVIPNAPIEIRERLANDTSGSLSLIFSDSAGLSPITQTGATANALGQFTFYAEPAGYNAVYDNNGTPVTIPVDVGVTGVVLNAAIDRLNPATLAIALADARLGIGDVLNLSERTTGNGGGAFWQVFPSGTYTVGATIFDVFDHDSLPLQLRLRRGILADVRQWGAVGDSVTDDTDAIRAAVGSQLDLVFPRGVYMVRAGTIPEGGLGGITPRSNSRWTMHQFAFLQAITNSASIYAILNLTNISFFTIDNCNLIGDRATHTGVTGESGHAVYMRNASHIVINGGWIRNAWGDAIYVGQQSNLGHNKAITVNDVTCDNNRRQGLSLVSVNGFSSDGCTFKNTNGTSPAAGIDIEPNNSDGLMQNIHFTNVRSELNEGDAGFTFNFELMTNSGPVAEPISITVDGYHDTGSNIGIAVTRCLDTMPGFIVFNNATCENNTLNGVKIRRWVDDGPRVEFNNIVIKDYNTSENVNNTDGAAITMYTLAADVTPTSGFANIHIRNPQFSRSPALAGTDQKVNMRDTTAGKVHNITIEGNDSLTDLVNEQDKGEWDLARMQITKAPFNANGTWTPSYLSYSGGAILHDFCFFSKSGNMITLTGRIQIPANTDTSQVRIVDLPYLLDPEYSGRYFSGTVGDTDSAELGIKVAMNDDVIISFTKSDGVTKSNLTYANMSGKFISFTVMYLTNIAT